MIDVVLADKVILRPRRCRPHDGHRPLKPIHDPVFLDARLQVLLSLADVIALAVAAIAEVTGRQPKLSTSGGTSDARFIKNYCPVLEFGLVGQTMHQTDEYTPVADLLTLTAIYRRIVEKYFGQGG